MGLLQVASSVVTSSTASVSLTGIDSDDVYMVAFNNVKGSYEPTNFSYRMTESGTANSTSNYDYAFKDMFAASGFATRYGSNANRTPFNQGSGSTAAMLNLPGDSDDAPDEIKRALWYYKDASGQQQGRRDSHEIDEGLTKSPDLKV